MSEEFQTDLGFDAVDAAPDDQTFVVDIDGYEGPLHVLLVLARTHKVDLLKREGLLVLKDLVDLTENARLAGMKSAAEVR